MLEILFVDKKTGHVNYGVTDVMVVRYISASEIGFTYHNGRHSSCAFTRAERIEVAHKTPSPIPSGRPLRAVA